MEGFTNSRSRVSPSAASPSSPLRSPAQPSPLNGTLIPRDYLGSLGRPPRSSSKGTVSASKSPSSSKPQSPTIPSFPLAQTAERRGNSEPDDELENRLLNPSDPATVDGAAINLNVAKTRPGTAAVSKHSDKSQTPLSAPLSSTSPVDLRTQAAMPRTSSIDSAISSISTASVLNRNVGDREPSTVEIRNLIATAGSAENLVHHLLRDKAHAAAQNAQLWKLVDKQRSLLLGLNKDLERISKDRDRYRKKAKDLAAAQTVQERHISGSHSPPRTPPTDELPIQMTESNEVHDEPRSLTTTGDVTSSPVDTGMMPSPLHVHLQQAPAVKPPKLSALSTTELAAPSLAVIAPTPVTSSPVQSFSSKRQIAPKPLDLRLSKEDSKLAELAASESAVVDAEGQAPERPQRGRRKTREEDDRDRELAALQQQQEEDLRSRSKKSNKSTPPKAKPEPPSQLLPAADISQAQPTKQIQHKPTASDASSHYSANDKEVVNLSPPMRSPGLPRSPRPMAMENAFASPESNAPLNSLPLSPRNNSFPLSPRAPKQPIPMPANLQSPKTLQPTLETTIPQRSESLNATVNEAAMASSSDIPPVYRGLIDPALPELLLPPNALPSIQVKVASSRLKPSRFSMLGLRPQEDTSVFSLSVFSRSNNRELWRIEKIPAALPHIDQQIRARVPEMPKLPERKLFSGHSPATLDARRMAIDHYFDELLDTHIDEDSALLICKFLSTDVLEPPAGLGARQTPNGGKQNALDAYKKSGYLTKKGKNFGGWKSRYFVLDSPELRYFESPGGAHLGTIKLTKAMIGRQTSLEGTNPEDPEGETNFRHAFLILEPKRKDSNAKVRHVLCAESDAERDDWVEALLRFIDDPSGQRPGTSGGDDPHPRTLLRGTDYADGQAEPKSSSPTLPHGTSGSGSPTSSSTPPIEQNAHQYATGTLGVPHNGRGNNRQSAVGQPQGKNLRNLFQFRKSSHEALNGPLHEQRSPQPPASARARGYVRPVFGLSLVEAVESCPPEGIDVEMPAIIYRCLEYLRGKKAINEEGLFRLSGSNIVIRTLRDRFNTEGDVDLLNDEEYYDVHAVASLFKSYLRELPASLLTREKHVEFLAILELPEKQQKLNALHVMINRLPHVNIITLRAICQYLVEVSSNQERNKMTVKNLGIVFSPTLSIPAPVFAMLLTDFDSIFGHRLDSYASQPSQDSPPSEVRSPRRQMFTDLPTPAYNQNSFNQNATGLAPRGYEHVQHYEQMGLQPLQQSYETRSYVSNPSEHAPPQPMYPAPAQPGHPGQGSHRTNAHDGQSGNPIQGTYRTMAPDVGNVKQKRRESAMMLF
jgi:RalA-binding protein 1